MNFKELCVIIPVHKKDISDDEIISLNACKNNLKSFDCFLVYPDGMDISLYQSVFDSLILHPVDALWLSSIENYNKMKMDIIFYNKFKVYKYMMTYELDAYIFSSELKKYHSFDFDYIGAPFFENYLQAKSDASFIKGGNSGFSIRNIQSCIKALKSMDSYYIHWLLYRIFLSKFPKIKFRLNRITNGKYDIFINGKLDIYFLKIYTNEDLFWSQIIPILFPSFRVADSISAAKFSFEVNPERLLHINNGLLPLGCHAWPKYKKFWQPFIKDIQL